MSENIFRTNIKNKEIIIVGTAHVSKKSTQLVEDTIIKEHPDTVAVELCSSRYKSIFEKDKWRNMDIIKVIKEKKVFLLLINIILSSFQKKIADKFGIKPGQEMITAIKESEKINAKLVLADRDINTTLARFWRSMSFWDKIKMFFQLIFSFGDSKEIKEEDIEKMKKEDMLQTILSELKKSHPILEKIIISERDAYLASKIQSASGNKIVAVVGAGHIPGIKKYITKEINIKEIETIPTAGISTTIIKWLIPALIIFAFAYGFMMKETNIASGMIKWWIIANGSFAGLGAIFALAHPITVCVSILAAPLTSLNPMIAAGWVAGLTEVFIRKPKVKDFENISKDVISVKGFWKNKITKILLITVLTNIGSSIGTMVALPIILKLMSS